VVEIAKKNATTGGRNDEDMNKLTRMFMSSASPDRRGAITNALTALEGKINSLQKLSNTHTSMGEWIELLFGRALLNPNFSVNHVDVHDSNGNVIAVFNDRVGWRNVLTEGELSRVRELAGLARDAYAAARDGIQAPQTAGNAGQQNGKPTVDITGEVIEPPALDVKV
jgi:hypothetical protein